MCAVLDASSRRLCIACAQPTFDGQNEHTAVVHVGAIQRKVVVQVWASHFSASISFAFCHISKLLRSSKFSAQRTFGTLLAAEWSARREGVDGDECRRQKGAPATRTMRARAKEAPRRMTMSHPLRRCCALCAVFCWRADN